MGSFYIKNNFPMVGIRETAENFMATLDSLINYDDGQGRKYDILDEELSEE